MREDNNNNKLNYPKFKYIYVINVNIYNNKI
jgi:hypothetical protein